MTKHTKTSMALSILLLTGYATNTSAATVPGVSTFGSGSVDVYSTLTTAPGSINARELYQTKNDSGQTSSTVQGAIADGGEYQARALIGSNTALPELGAYTRADVDFYPDDVGSPIGVKGHYLYDASATARGIQAYTYTGSTSTTYNLQFVLEGSLMGDDYDSVGTDIYIGGSQYDIDDPWGEVRAPDLLGSDGSYINADMLDASTTAATFNEMIDIAFTVDPGDLFYVDMELWASSGNRSTANNHYDGYVDAMNTLTASFTSGDTTLLTPQLTAVPVPAAIWLFGSGLIGLVGLGRRQSRA